MQFENFFGKILLFGEYAVLREGAALTIPYRNASGHLGFQHSESESDNQWSNDELRKFAKHLEKIEGMDILRFKHDVQSGLVFSSTIPAGYGVGSSGALVAAVFHQYCNLHDSIKNNLTILKLYLSRMESFFHGASSGIDPLSCYLGMPLVINNCVIQIQSIPPGNYKHIFLLDSAQQGSTNNLVKLFYTKCGNKEFCRIIDEELLQANSRAIDGIINNNYDNLLNGFKKISVIEYNWFREMIPESICPVWKKGLDTGQYYLKLCGSGGGGFIAGILNGSHLEISNQFKISYLQ